MKLQELEDKALHLPEKERAELAQKLILSLEETNQEDLDQQWLLEAQSRARDLDEGKVRAIPAEEVREKAKALLR